MSSLALKSFCAANVYFGDPQTFLKVNFHQFVIFYMLKIHVLDCRVNFFKNLVYSRVTLMMNFLSSCHEEDGLRKKVKAIIALEDASMS